MKSIEIPEWFDQNLISILKDKIDRSSIKKRYRTMDWIARQALKLDPRFDTKKLTWKDIEEIIEENCSKMDYQPDIIIGVKSGGAFIANYVANCLNNPEVDYMKISHYSDNSGSIVKSAATCLKKDAIIKEKPKAKLEDRKVLIVDDQTATGSTLKVGVEYMKQEKVKDAKTFCLYTKKPKVDFCTRKGLMVYTPWGKDA